MKILVLALLSLAVVCGGMVACSSTHESAPGFSAVRPPGSGGRGMSPGQEEKTSKGAR